LKRSGYPDALAADDVAIEARVVAVADTYSAITFDRPRADSDAVGALAGVAVTLRMHSAPARHARETTR
jgi:hypothetical protein